MKVVADQIAPWLPGRLVTLGTDGFGRSENREHLRKHFENGAEAIAAATLGAPGSRRPVRQGARESRHRRTGTGSREPRPCDEVAAVRMLYLSEEDVREFLPMQAAIGVMRGAFEALAEARRSTSLGGVSSWTRAPCCTAWPASYGNYFGTKFYSTHPRYGAHFYFVLYDAQTAEPLAWMEANHLGQIRTGAATGYATDLLANPEAETLGVIGSGFQARTQVEAIRAVRPIKTVRVWSRSEEKRRKFAEECSAQAVDTAEEAVRGAQIVVTATNSAEPVLEDGWIAPGTMINAMGSNVATRRELPGELVRRAALVAVDSLEQAKMEAGDLILADSWANVVELKDVKPHFDPAKSPSSNRLELAWKTWRREPSSTSGRWLLLNGLLIGIAPGADLQPAANPAQTLR